MGQKNTVFLENRRRRSQQEAGKEQLFHIMMEISIRASVTARIPRHANVLTVQHDLETSKTYQKTQDKLDKSSQNG